jgi:hypothetical protein
MVESAFGDSGVGDQIVKADILLAVLQKQPARPVQQLRPADVDV